MHPDLVFSSPSWFQKHTAHPSWPMFSPKNINTTEQASKPQMFPRAGGAWDFYCTNTGLLPDWVRWHSAPRLLKTTSQTLLYSLPSHLIKNVLFSQNLESPDLRVWLQNSQFQLLSFILYISDDTTAFFKLHITNDYHIKKKTVLPPPVSDLCTLTTTPSPSF